MKKLIALLLAVSVLFSLALTGCKSETPDDIGDNETAASGKDPDRLIKIGFVFSAIVSTDAWSQMQFARKHDHLHMDCLLCSSHHIRFCQKANG